MMGKTKKEDDSFLSKTIGGKTKQCYHNDICTWKRAVFPMKLKLQGESFQKDPMNLTETNPQINMTTRVSTYF